jgi:hypothetical protein
MIWILIVYVLSVIGAYYANKLAYKLRISRRATIESWFIPCWNSVYILLSLVVIFVEKSKTLNDIIEEKWDR